MSGADWLREQARVCHELATARGKYRRYVEYVPSAGWADIYEELMEWYAELSKAKNTLTPSAEPEFGDFFHAVLSVAHHFEYDLPELLADAQERNRQRIGEGE